MKTAEGNHYFNNLFMGNADVWTDEHNWVMTKDRFEKVVKEMLEEYASQPKDIPDGKTANDYWNENCEVIKPIDEGRYFITPEIFLKCMKEYASQSVPPTPVTDKPFTEQLVERILTNSYIGSKISFPKLSKLINKEAIEWAANKDKGERMFTETEIGHLQSEVYKLTGKGEVMMLFNKLLGVSAS